MVPTKILQHEHLLPSIVLLLMLRMSINLYYLATIVYNVKYTVAYCCSVQTTL